VTLWTAFIADFHPGNQLPPASLPIRQKPNELPFRNGYRDEPFDKEDDPLLAGPSMQVRKQEIGVHPA